MGNTQAATRETQACDEGPWQIELRLDDRLRESLKTSPQSMSHHRKCSLAELLLYDF